jgi:hypothetical protein
MHLRYENGITQKDITLENDCLVRFFYFYILWYENETTLKDITHRKTIVWSVCF